MENGCQLRKRSGLSSAKLWLFEIFSLLYFLSRCLTSSFLFLFYWERRKPRFSAVRLLEAEIQRQGCFYTPHKLNQWLWRSRVSRTLRRRNNIKKLENKKGSPNWRQARSEISIKLQVISVHQVCCLALVGRDWLNRKNFGFQAWQRSEWNCNALRKTPAKTYTFRVLDIPLLGGLFLKGIECFRCAVPCSTSTLIRIHENTEVFPVRRLQTGSALNQIAFEKGRRACAEKHEKGASVHNSDSLLHISLSQCFHFICFRFFFGRVLIYVVIQSIRWYDMIGHGKKYTCLFFDE